MKKSLLRQVCTGALLSTAALCVHQAYAAGFQLTEQSSLGVGRAYAGAGIVGDDLSAVHYNPAGMTLLPGTQFQAGSVWIDVNASIDGKGANEGKSENGRYKGQAIPAGFLTHQVTEDVWLGLGLTVPFGMGTDYDSEWFGSERGYTSTILTFDINPNVAWRVNDFLSVGGGVSLQYAKAKLGSGLYTSMPTPVGARDVKIGNGKIDADSWDWGYNLGIMLSPSEKLRLGLSYRSAIEHNAEGDFKFSAKNQALSVLSGTYDAKATVKTPDTVMLTATWEVTDALRLSGLVRWAKWSNFKTLTIKNDTGSNPYAAALQSKSYENDWDDTWLFSVGADYRINDAWTVRCGIAYEKDPVGDETKRMAVIPDTDRLWLALGATWNVSKALQIDAGLAYLHGIGNKDLYNEAGTRKIGEYDQLDATILGLQAQYRF